MSTTAVATTWTPETPDERDLKQSFKALATAPEKAIIQVSDGEGSTEDKFILRSRAYYGEFDLAWNKALHMRSRC